HCAQLDADQILERDRWPPWFKVVGFKTERRKLLHKRKMRKQRFLRQSPKTDALSNCATGARFSRISRYALARAATSMPDCLAARVARLQPVSVRLTGHA